MHFNTQDRMTLQLKPNTAVHVCTGSIVKPVAVTPMHGSHIGYLLRHLFICHAWVRTNLPSLTGAVGYYETSHALTGSGVSDAMMAALRAVLSAQGSRLSTWP